jgi:hypothetical protein
LSFYPELAELLTERLRSEERNASWLAKRLGVHPATVGRWLEGSARPDRPETVLRIADCLRLHTAAEKTRLLAAAGYAAMLEADLPVAPVTPPAQHRSPLVHIAGRTAARLPGWLAAPLLAQPAIYAAMPWPVQDALMAAECGNAGLNLGQQRLAISSAFGSYFAGLLERDHIYVDGLTQLPPLERMAWTLNHPRGPRALVIAAEAGMGKSTLAAQLLRCLLQQGDFDLLIGDSAKQSRVNLASGAVESLEPRFWSVDSCFAHLRSQLGLPPSDAASAVDIGDRLAGRRTLIVLDNLESVRDRDELLRRLHPLLNRDVRAVMTARQVDVLPAFAQTHMLVHLHPLAQAAHLADFLRWHVERHAAEQPLLRNALQQPPDLTDQRQLLQRTGGIPLLIQLVFSSVARLSWAYLDHLPHLYGDELLAFLYAERWQELAAAAAAGRCAQELLHSVALAQSKGERVELLTLQRWAERTQTTTLLPAALDLLYERFLLVNSDRTIGNFALFPSLAEYVLRSRPA